MTSEHTSTPAGSALTPASSASSSVAERTARVVLYSDNAETRLAVRRAVGRRASKDTPFVEWMEVATGEMLMSVVGAGGNDLVIMDGETAKIGSFGLARELKDTFFDVPPVLLLIARPQDAWLASWSQAEGVVPYPLRPAEVAEAVAGLLRGRVAAS